MDTITLCNRVRELDRLYLAHDAALDELRRSAHKGGTLAYARLLVQARRAERAYRKLVLSLPPDALDQL